MHARIAAHAGEARLARRGVILKEGTSRSPLGFFLPLRLRERLRLLAGLHRSRLVFWRGRANILASVLGLCTENRIGTDSPKPQQHAQDGRLTLSVLLRMPIPCKHASLS
eukprot:100335-Rhodomonas_salina.1